jgi:ankyrin repeat protein
MCKLLIRKGAKINHCNFNYHNALTYICDANLKFLYYDRLNDIYKIAKLLIKNNININHRTQFGVTALMFAHKHNNNKLIKLLLKYDKTNLYDNKYKLYVINYCYFK